jgi:hypothetical protein
VIGKEKLTGLADTAFDLMEGEAPDDATIGACVLVCEVRIRQPNGDEATAFYMHSTDRRGWVQRALLEEAQTAAAFEA